MIDGKFVPARRGNSYISKADLLTRLRVRGITHLDEVGVAIVESRGSVTVVLKGETIDSELLTGVGNWDRIPERYLSEPVDRA